MSEDPPKYSEKQVRAILTAESELLSTAQDPSKYSQEQLVRLGELLLNEYKHQHQPGTWEREAYEGALGMLGTFPHQPWYKRIWGATRKRLAEFWMRKLRKLP